MENQKALFNLPDYVLVHPDLSEDPVTMQGQVGRLTYAVVNHDEFHVGFDNKEVGVYDAAALLVLRDADSIFSYLDVHKNSLTEIEQNTLISIGLMEMYAIDSTYQKEAFSIALQYPSLTAAVLLSVEERLQLNRGPEMDR